MHDMPWFRLYSEAVDDEKLRLLAFEDRWHFVAILCCKSKGILEDPSDLMRRKVAVKLGIDLATLEDVSRRLAEVGLIDQATLQPLKWDERQFNSDNSTPRVRRYRQRLENTGNVTETFHETVDETPCNVSVTAQDTDTDTDTEVNTTYEEGRGGVGGKVAQPAGKPAAHPTKTTIPKDFKPSARVAAWAATKGYNRVEEHCDAFVCTCQAHRYRYADWDAALMKAIRDDWAKLRSPPDQRIMRDQSRREASRVLTGRSNGRDINGESERIT